MQYYKRTDLKDYNGVYIREKDIALARRLAQKDCDKRIPYKYECPLKLKGGRTFYPDFTVLNVRERKEMYWEHLGMMDDAEYVEKAIQKIAVYEQNGIYQGDRLVLTYETKKSPIDLRAVRRMVDRWFK